MKQSLILLVFLLVATTATAELPKFRIGVLAPLSGNFASYGDLVQRAIQAVQHPEIEWVFEDEACDPAKAVSAYRKLTAVDGVSFLIGPGCGSSQKAIAPLLKGQNQLALLSSAAPASVFADSGGKMYSVQYALEAEGAFLARTLNERGLTKVAVVYVDNEFSRTLDAGFRAAFAGAIVYSFQAPSFDVQYMKTAAVKLKGLEFDALFIPDAAPLLLGFLTELNRVGVPRRPTFSIYSAQMPDVITSEKLNAEGLLYSYPDVPDGETAIEHYSSLAAKILARVVRDCEGQYNCVSENFRNNKSFQSDGTLKGEIILKAVRDGKFVQEEKAH